jgi:hypothetical protein
MIEMTTIEFVFYCFEVHWMLDDFVIVLYLFEIRNEKKSQPCETDTVNLFVAKLVSTIIIQEILF